MHESLGTIKQIAHKLKSLFIHEFDSSCCKTSVHGLAVVAICNFTFFFSVLRLAASSLSTPTYIHASICIDCTQQHAIRQHAQCDTQPVSTTSKRPTWYVCADSSEHTVPVCACLLLPSSNLCLYTVLSCFRCDCHHKQRRKNKRELIHTNIAMCFIFLFLLSFSLRWARFRRCS